MNFYYSYYLYSTKVVLIAKNYIFNRFFLYLIDFYIVFVLFFVLDLNESKHNIFLRYCCYETKYLIFRFDYILVSILNNL
jgi:hypothetical protein